MNRAKSVELESAPQQTVIGNSVTIDFTLRTESNQQPKLPQPELTNTPATVGNSDDNISNDSKEIELPFNRLSRRSKRSCKSEKSGKSTKASLHLPLDTSKVYLLSRLYNVYS